MAHRSSLRRMIAITGEETRMPYVKRDESGQITAVFDRRVEQIGEELAADHPDITEFLARVGRTAPIRENLERSDAAMGRVLEDLIDVLIDKRVILVTDLPTEAMGKISRRQNLRDDLNAVAGLLSDDTDKII
jgi:hypothetical protein